MNRASLLSRRIRLGVGLALWLIVPASASAQSSVDAGFSRGFISFGAGVQVASTDFSETHSQPLNGETETWTANYSQKTGLELEAGGGWRAWQNLFVAGTYTHAHDSRSAEITASVPHPFFFNQPRQISGESGSLSHTEDAAHISALWLVPAGERFEVGVFGGPSIIWVTQPLVKDVQYREQYPYDTAEFSVAPAEDASETAFGFHVGADVTWLLSRQFGVGGTVRYTRASVDLASPAGGSVSFDAGGFQAAVTVKVRFMPKAFPGPAKPAATPVPAAPPAPPGTMAGPIQRGITTATAPVYLRADATRPPLRQLPTGTQLRILDTVGDWFQVEFNDTQYGRRVGYIQKAFVQLEPIR